MPLFTVFTPAYNRAHTLHRVWDSLKAQTLRDFEWLVIDDGSTDNTRELVAQYQREADFPVRYMLEPHRGAWAVHNVSLREAKGTLWVKLDSDDGCLPNALERFKHHWESIPETERGRYAGVTALCQDQDGHLVGTKYPREPLDCSATELEYRYKVRGEKWGCVRLDVIQQFPFPENLQGVYIPEHSIWCRVAKNYITRHVNEIVRIYWTDAPSLVTGRPDPRRNAAGHRYWCQSVLNMEHGWFFSDPLRLFRASALYTRFSMHTGADLARQWADLESSGARWLWMLGCPAGLALWLRDKFTH